jgi:hypothetical protein
MATRVLHGIKFFEQISKVTAKGTFLWSLDEIGLVVYEEMSFKVNVYGRWTGRRATDEKRSQKVTLSLCDSWANKVYPILYAPMFATCIFIIPALSRGGAWDNHVII